MKEVQLTKMEHRGEVRIQVDFSYDSETILLVKSIKGHKWSQSKKCWHLPYTKGSYALLQQHFNISLSPTESPLFVDDTPSKSHEECDQLIQQQELSKPKLSKSKEKAVVQVLPEHDFRMKVFVPFERKDWIQKLKRLSNRAWNTEEKYWSVPKTASCLTQLQHWFGEDLRVAASINWETQASPTKANRIQTTPSAVSANNYQTIKRDRRIIKTVVGQKIIIEQEHPGWLRVFIPYDKKGWIEVVKNITGRKWNAEEKYWLVPYVKDSLVLLKNYIGQDYLQINFEIDSTIPQSVSYVVKHQKIKDYNADLNEMQQRALLALEEKLILEGKRERTIKTYKNQLRAFLRFYKNHRPSKITFKEITKYIIVRKKQDNISDSSLNQLINALNAFYVRVLEQEEKLAKLERPPKRKNLPNVFSEQEIELILKSPTNLKHKCMLILIYSAGLRKQEVLNLRVNDLNFERKTVFIKDGKGGKDRYSFFSEVAMKYIKPYLKQYHPSIWLFEGQTGGQYSPTSIQMVFERARQKARVNPLVTLHGLRHSFATHLVEKGIPLHVVQDLLGHSSIKTTEIYLHISNKFRKELKSPLDNMNI